MGNNLTDLPYLSDLLSFDIPKVETTYSNLRRRALEERSRRIDAELERRSLSSSRVAGRLPEYKISSETLRSIQRKTRDEVTFIEQQNAAARSERESFNKLTPLQARKKVASDLYRSEKDRIDAIAGKLERERLQRKKLSRDQFDRVQAKAAARVRHHHAKDSKYAGVDVYRDAMSTKREVRARDKVIEKLTGKHKWCEGKELRREVLAAAGFPRVPRIPRVFPKFGDVHDFERYESVNAIGKLIRCF